MVKIDFLAEAEAMRDDVVAWRRDFHRNPELAFQETRTAGIVAEHLQSLGMEVQTGIGQTGVIGILDGAEDGPTVLMRADMDALPILEANDTEYVSTKEGIMHACGHDGHTAIGMGVAQLLAGKRDQIKGRVKFVFQPAEEIGSGAKAMVADGALTSPAPDYSVGLHLWNGMPTGMIGLASGSVMAGASNFDITITGKGGHGALPDLAIDPVVCAAQIVVGLQTIVSRNADPISLAVVSATKVIAGTAHNIIPETASISGTFRTYTIEIRDMVEKRIAEVAQGIGQAMNCEIEVDIQHHTKPVINDEAVARTLREKFVAMGFDNIVEERTMGAEDVSEFMMDTPGTYFFLGSADEDRGLHYPHHHPKFDFDENALPMGVALLAQAVSAYVIE